MPLTGDIRRRLIDVLEKLEPLSEQNGLLKFLRNEDHAGSLGGFIEDIARAVTDYQVCGQNTQFNVTNYRSDLSSTKHVREYQRYDCKYILKGRSCASTHVPHRNPRTSKSWKNSIPSITRDTRLNIMDGVSAELESRSSEVSCAGLKILRINPYSGSTGWREPGNPPSLRRFQKSPAITIFSAQASSFPGLFGQKGAQEYLPLARISTRLPLPSTPGPPHQGHQAGPLGSPQLPHLPVEGPAGGSAFCDRHLLCHRHRCAGRVCR